MGFRDDDTYETVGSGGSYGDETLSDNDIEDNDTFIEGEGEDIKPDQTVIMGKKKEALAWLVRIEKGKPVKKIRLKEGSNVVGRDTRHSIVLDEEEISKEHAKIIRNKKGNYKVMDLGSYNGTYLNGKKIKAPRILDDEDVLSFADIKFIFKRI